MFDPKRFVRASIQAAMAAAAFTIASPLFGADEEGAKVAEKPFRRLDKSTEDELRLQLAEVPKFGFSQAELTTLYTGGAKRLGLASRLDAGPSYYEKLRLAAPGEFHSLPWRVRTDAQLDEAAARTLDNLSVRLRTSLRELSTSRSSNGGSAIVGKSPVDPKALAHAIRVLIGKHPDPETIPTLLQLLQAEPAPVRGVLVETLGEIKGPQASVALARRAVFDLSPEIREKAVRILKTRPAPEYADALVSTLRYPWPPAAYHAAEAIAFLELKDSVRQIDALSREDDPRAPSVGRGTMEKTDTLVTRELVCVNHLCNCLLCHAPSKASDDLVRGKIPMPGEDLEIKLYYNEPQSAPPSPGAIFARADITYLRQEFSVTQPVSLTERFKWPAEQRYDYMVRQRKLPSPGNRLQAPLNLLQPLGTTSAAPAFDVAKLPDFNFNQKAALFALLAVRTVDAPTGALVDPPAALRMPLDAPTKKK